MTNLCKNCGHEKEKHIEGRCLGADKDWNDKRGCPCSAFTPTLPRTEECECTYHWNPLQPHDYDEESIIGCEHCAQGLTPQSHEPKSDWQEKFEKEFCDPDHPDWINQPERSWRIINFISHEIEEAEARGHEKAKDLIPRIVKADGEEIGIIKDEARLAALEEVKEAIEKMLVPAAHRALMPSGQWIRAERKNEIIANILAAIETLKDKKQ